MKLTTFYGKTFLGFFFSCVQTLSLHLRYLHSQNWNALCSSTHIHTNSTSLVVRVERKPCINSIRRLRHTFYLYLVFIRCQYQVFHLYRSVYVLFFFVYPTNRVMYSRMNEKFGNYLLIEVLKKISQSLLFSLSISV